MNENDIINKITNHAVSLTTKSLISINSFAENQSKKSLAKYTSHSDKIIHSANTKLKVITINYKSNKKTSQDIVIASTVTNLNSLKTNIGDAYSIKLNGFGNSMGASVADNIKSFGATLSDKFNVSTTAITNIISASITNAVNSLKSAVTNLIASFTGALNLLHNAAMSTINGIANAIGSAFATAKTAVASVKEKFDFYKKAKGSSSTSQYIQANVPNKAGTLAPNAKALIATPDAKILAPLLKKEVNTTTVMKANPLAALLGITGSLIPSQTKVEIAEPKPTGDKAQYGKIQVKETKGGFVEINDDSVGNVRKILQHPSGTYFAMLDNGDLNSKCANDRQDITVGNWHLTVSKDKVVVVAENQKIEIRKNNTTQINGNDDLVINGTKNEVVKGDVSNDYKSNLSTKVTSNSSENVDGNKKVTVGGNVEETISGNQKENITGNLTIHVTGSCNIISGGACTIASGSKVSISAPSISLG